MQRFAARSHLPGWLRIACVFDRAARHAACSPARMHAIPFRLKRAYQASLKMLRPIAARHDLTPARFDLLYALRAMRPYAQDQTALSNRLGVTRATIGKMVRALEKAGFLERHPSTRDRRYRRLEITRYGRRCFAKLLKRIPVVEKNYYRSMFHWEQSRLLRSQFFGQMNWRTAHLARALGDGASLYR